MKPIKIREMREEEINAKLKELRAESMKLKLSRSKGELKNPIKQREVRHDIARLLTILKEKGWKN